MSKSDSPKYVTALFSFKGKNNDELCFKKGDVITITQTDEEGWWEGTLHDKTGWFPSNYVKECRVPDSGVSAVKASPEKIQQESPTHQKLNRDIVLKDIVDSERVNVAELQGLINSFLHPLESANILSKEEYKQLLGNIQEIMEVHQRLLNNLETTMAQGCASRVGNLFLTLAPKLKSIHTAYCGNHPRAVCVLDRYRDELNDFMERNGAISPGILVLTTGLSKPFRRLDKYSAMLQELERYTEKNHPDRGDTQRSIVVYREIADRCASIRKQRELALQVLTSGIKGWEGEELSSLGEILYVGSVTIANGTNGLDRRDRYFVLFPTTLLVLSTSPRMSSFVYEGKLPLTGINIIRKEDSEEIRNAFEITGPMIESILVLCTSKEERQRWIELLIQEQTASNSLVKSPTTSRVSSYLPPYARLSRYFAKLVKKKIIRPELLKKLLYLQYVLKPDMSNVKMRRPNLTTYVLFPMRTSSEERESNCSEIDSFDTSKLMEKRSHVGPTMLRKSTLTLDVKYALGNMDLSTVGIGKDSSRELASESDSIQETSKSLPVTVFNSASGCIDADNRNETVGANDRSRFTNQFPHSFPIVGNVDKERVNDVLTDICWKNNGRVQEQPVSAASIEHPIVLTRNSNTEHRFRTSTLRNIELDSRTNVSLDSLDSGMDESYRLNSSEINSSCKSYKRDTEGPARNSYGESENDEVKFECQCVCTSPFDSTPRDSAHLSDLSRNVDNVLDTLICDTSASNVSSSTQPSYQLNEMRLAENAISLVPDNFERATQRRFTQPIPYSHRTDVARKVGRKAAQPSGPLVVENDYPGTSEIYTSGLYVHWWLKKSVPLSGCTEQDLQSTERETATTAATAAAAAAATKIDRGALHPRRN
ncbi:rho guanine nucleotide exchange factor 6 isoform X1 [Osmia bicornis bicornis]|uniref:rho guanine nucleotide exchange factor 6 isoform X1 n=1 Tax=Osmia bicornis bicornis TaxID=1437191 RepID=UPI0010F58609|nr:rho guanine nucleotide exchange factor 6 isoform X1 [Osmia bicornis bicornis]